MQVISVVENLKYNTLYVDWVEYSLYFRIFIYTSAILWLEIYERCVRTHAVSMYRN